MSHRPHEAGPWFTAMYPGECSLSGERFYEGAMIRADGDGGYECRDCVEDHGYLDDEDDGDPFSGYQNWGS